MNRLRIWMVSTIVGDVIEGMENIDKIKRGGGASGMVREPDRIIKMRPASSETA